MNPEELAKTGSESGEQKALFCWANMAAVSGFAIANDMRMYTRGPEKINGFIPVPQLKWLHAIPNAGARGNPVAASQLKAEGVKAGVADIFLPVPKWKMQGRDGSVDYDYMGLYIELKREDRTQSNLSLSQKEFANFVTEQGYLWRVAFGWKEAANIIQAYLTHA